MKINKKFKKSTVLTIATASIMITALTMAYFVSSDAVSNRLNSKNPSAEILEPEWYNSGMNLASAFEPGMLIDKNPYARNNGETDIYLRIKMHIGVTKSKNRNLADSANPNNPNEIYQLSVEQVRDRILQAIRMKDRTTPLIKNISQDGEIEICHNMFQCDITDTCDYVVEKSKTEKNTYYFYFVRQALNNVDDSELIVLHPGECSAELFNYVDIPTYKKDYIGVFDQSYSILLTAESLPAESCDNTVAEFKKLAGS